MPDARSGHSAVSWRGELVLFGGSDAQHRFNDTWIMAVSVPAGGSARQLLATWRKLKVRADVRPPGRVGHTGSLVGDSLYVFGGLAPPNNVYDNIWKLDLSAPEPRWEELHVTGTPPAPRVCHAAVVLGDQIVVVGGRGSHIAGASGEYATGHGLATMGELGFFAGGLVVLDTTRGRWLPIQHPWRWLPQHSTSSDHVQIDNGDDDDVQERVWEHRSGHVMVPAERGLLVIGGQGYNGEFLNDVLRVEIL